MTSESASNLENKKIFNISSSTSTPVCIVSSGETENKDFTTQNLTFNYPQYFRHFFNFSYYLLIAPFYITCIGHEPSISNKLQTNVIQKAVCFSFQSLVALVVLFRIMGHFTVNMYSNPKFLFNVVFEFITAMQLYAYLYTLWFRKHLFIGTFWKSSKPPSRHNIFVPAVLILLDTSSWLYYHYAEYRSFFHTGDLRQAVGFSKRMFYLQNDTSPVPEDQPFTPAEYCLTGAIFFISFYARIIVGTAEVFAYLSAISVYDSVTAFQPHFSPMVSDGEISSSQRQTMKRTLIQLTYIRLRSFSLPNEKWIKEKMYGAYRNMQCHICQINGAVSNMFLWTTSEFLTFLAQSLFVILANEHPVFERIAAGLQVIKYTATFFLAAEAYDRATSYKERLMEQMCKLNPNKYQTDAVFIEATAYQLGLMGGKFFTVSYGFIGATVGVLLTCVLVMVQFEIAPTQTKGSA